VQEYFQYDPTADYLRPQLQGRRLHNGEYEPIPAQVLAGDEVSLPSAVLGLDLRLVAPEQEAVSTPPSLAPVAKALRFFDPQTGEKLLNYAEAEAARRQAEQALQEAEQALGDVEQAQLKAAGRLLQRGLTPEEVAEILELPLAAVLPLTAG
jgi:hypothetical protein